MLLLLSPARWRGRERDEANRALSGERERCWQKGCEL